MDSSHFISSPRGRIHYRQWGSGSRLIIAFHGFANQSVLFEPIALAMPDEVTFIALDLPFHGRTQWDAKVYTQADVKQWISTLLSLQATSTFEWMGFSLGARIILATCSDMDDSLRGIHLIAPDGIATYRTTLSQLVPVFFRRQLHRVIAAYPGACLRLTQRLHDWRLIDHFSMIYIEKQLRSALQIDRLFQTWLSLPQFKVNRRSVRKHIIETQLPIHLCLGKQDKFVDSHYIQAWAIPIPHLKYQLFEQGHHLIKPALGQYFQEAL